MTLTRTGMISKKEYEELKPYYDYQRKVLLYIVNVPDLN